MTHKTLHRVAPHSLHPLLFPLLMPLHSHWPPWYFLNMPDKSRLQTFVLAVLSARCVLSPHSHWLRPAFSLLNVSYEISFSLGGLC